MTPEEKENAILDNFMMLLKAGVIFTYQDIKTMPEIDQKGFLAAAELYEEYKIQREKGILADVVLPTKLECEIQAAQARMKEFTK